MTTRVLASASPGEVRVAAASGDTLLDYALWRPGKPDGVGDLHRGRVSALVPAMAGAFVTLDGTEGFLPDSEGAKPLTEGTVLAVRITRAAQGGKGPRLSANVSEEDRRRAGNGPPALLRRGPNPVEQMAAAYPDAPVLVDDAALLAALRPALGERLSFAATVFSDELESAIEALAEAEVMLHNGARLAIHPTPALVAIDVDAGAAIADQRGKAERHFAVNRAILPELAAQIRLRNLSGAILVDFAGLPARRRARLAPDLADALAADKLRPRLLGFTALGLAEIVRPRVHPPLHELLAGPHAAGLAALRAVARQAAANPAWPPALHAAPSVLRALQDDTVALDDLRRRTGRALLLQSDPGLGENGWRTPG